MLRTYKTTGAAFCAALLNIGWLCLTLLFCDSKYGISDDFVIASVLSGGYGSYTSYVPYVNILLNKCFKLLYITFPAVGWFYVYQILLGFISFLGISFVLIRNNGMKNGLLLSVLMLVFFADDIYLLPTYTKTAGLAVLAGGILILNAVRNRKKHAFLWMSGSLVLIGGSLLRKESCILCLPFLAFFFLRHIFFFIRMPWDKDADSRMAESAGEKPETAAKKPLLFVLQNLVLCLIPVVIVAGAVFLDGFLWNRKEAYALYNRYNNARSLVTDTAGFGYASVKEGYQELGLDETDYKMINS